MPQAVDFTATCTQAIIMSLRGRSRKVILTENFDIGYMIVPKGSKVFLGVDDKPELDAVDGYSPYKVYIPLESVGNSGCAIFSIERNQFIEATN